MRQWLLAVPLLLLLQGCDTVKNIYHAVIPPAKPKPTTLSLTVQAAEGINPNSRNEPSPLTLIYYELVKPDHFSQSDFLLLFQNEEKQLGAELVSRRQFPPVIPGESYTYNFVLDSKTKFIGLLAAFSRFKEGVNRQVQHIKANEDNRFRLTVEGNRILLTQDEE